MNNIEILLKIKKLCLQYLCGFIFAWGTMLMLGIFLAYALISLLNFFNPYSSALYGDFIGGIGIRIGMFLTIPFGASLGILLIDKLWFMSSELNSYHYKWRFITACLMGIVGSALVYWVLPLFFGEAVFGWLPFIGHMYITFGNESFLLISPVFALIGYNAAEYFNHKKKANKSLKVQDSLKN